MDVTIQFKLYVESELTKLSLSDKQNSLHLLTLALAPAPQTSKPPWNEPMASKPPFLMLTTPL